MKSLALVLLQDREVISIQIEDKETLTEGQWSYSLDFRSEAFKEQMGRHWSGVTWRVTLAKKDDDSLWQVAKAWKPLFAAWESHKRSLLAGKLNGHHRWFKADRGRDGKAMWADMGARLFCSMIGIRFRLIWGPRGVRCVLS